MRMNQTDQCRLVVLNLALMLVVALLSSCSFIQQDVAEETVEKSPNDPKEYRYLVMPNGLKVLLISDAKALETAAAMDVYVGSMQDPADRQGLAHFVEHMLFLGTKKYPDAAEFAAFIDKHGGSNNAFTTTEHTNYHFTVNGDVAAEALDRFAQFFIAPLFDKHYVAKEINAIEAEFKATIKDDSRRRVDVIKTIANPKNTWHQFTGGNAVTLKPDDPKLLTDMKAFYKKWYSAQNMALSVTGNQSLDMLETLVIQSFSEIPSFKVKHKAVKEPLFAPGFLPRWVNSRPEKNLKALTVLFPTPDYSKHYQTSPLMLIGHLLGHEGEGSLYAYLKKKNWIETLVAGTPFSYDGGEAFSVSLGLTDQGLENQQQVVDAVFQAIERVKSAGVPKWVFDEVADIGRLNFLFPEDTTELNRVTYFASALHLYPPADLLQAGYLLTDYNPRLIEDALSYLRPDNTLISVVSYGFTYVELTPYYQVPYTVSAMPGSVLAKISDGEMNPEIVLPTPNDLLPEDLKLPNKPEASEAPSLLTNRSDQVTWFHASSEFVTPRASSYFSFYQYKKHRPVAEEVALDMYVEMLNDSLSSLVYPAYLANMGFGISRKPFAISLRIRGFEPKQEALLKKMVAGIKSSQFTQEQFDRIKNERMIRLANQFYEQPYKRAFVKWQETLWPQIRTLDETKKALKALTLEQVNQVAAKFWAANQLVSLSNGALDETQVKAMAEYLRQSFPVKQAKSEHFIYEMRKISSPFYQQIETPYTDKAYLYYWQSQNQGIHEQADWQLMSKYLESGYFDTLRTEQQLGYVVYADYYPVFEFGGMIFVVQSPNAGINQIHQSTQAYLKQKFDALDALTAAEFDAYRAALIDQWQDKPKNLRQETKQYWNAIVNGFGFDRKQKMVDALQQVTLAQWKVRVKKQFGQLPQGSILLGSEDWDLLEETKAHFPEKPEKSVIIEHIVDPSKTMKGQK
ncbi:MAG: insulinase family protein [Cellvibrionales bacterium]|nr:insulinase family protein [Cellvibrionales bacterium]